MPEQDNKTENWSFSPDHNLTFIKHHYGHDINPQNPPNNNT